MGLKKNNPGCNCCEEGCLIGADAFSRSAVGVDWSQEAGSWSIVSNRLFTNSTNAHAKYQTSHPDSEGHHYVFVEVDLSGNGDIAQVIMGDNVVFELEYNTPSANQHTVTIYDDGAVAVTEVLAYSGSPPWEIHAYYREDYGIAVLYIESFIGATNCLMGSITSSPSTFYVGLGTGDTNASGIYFDNFAYTKAQSTTNPECDWDFCTLECVDCSDENTMEVLLVRLYDFVSGVGACDCTPLNNTFALIPGARYQAGSGWSFRNSCYWGNEFVVACNGSSATLQITTRYYNNLGYRIWAIVVRLTKAGVGTDVAEYRKTLYSEPYGCRDNQIVPYYGIIGYAGVCSSWASSDVEVNP